MSARTDCPTVSIVMPCFNALAHLPSSVASVLAQHFGDWELIAVDDGSTDGTLAWLQAQGDSRIVAVGQHNQGVSAARNAGLAQARGRYVAFLDADDTWAPQYLERMVGALDSHPDSVLAYCGWQNLGLGGGRGEPFVPPNYEGPGKLETLFAGCRWPVHAALARGEAIRATGGFDRTLKNAEDYALWLELAGTSPIVRVPDVLAFYHFHGGQQASSDRARAALQLLQAQLAYMERHPEFARRLERKRRRELVYGNLKHAAFDAYWHRDLDTARTLFRKLLQAGYGTMRDWLYMLPALLPARIHRTLLGLPASDRAQAVKDSMNSR